MIGLAAYLGVLAAMLLASWRLANLPHATDEARRAGMLAVAAVAAYLPSAVFHDLSLVHSDQWLLFLIVGIALSYERRLGGFEERSTTAPFGLSEPHGVAAA
jgi:hypothetical protein